MEANAVFLVLSFPVYGTFEMVAALSALGDAQSRTFADPQQVCNVSKS